MCQPSGSGLCLAHDLLSAFDSGVAMTQGLDRITQQPDVMGGKACIRGMRVTVGMVVGQVGAGRSIEEILADYPYLEREDIMQALRYAAWRAEEREVMLTNGKSNVFLSGRGSLDALFV